MLPELLYIPTPTSPCISRPTFTALLSHTFFALSAQSCNLPCLVCVIFNTDEDPWIGVKTSTPIQLGKVVSRGSVLAMMIPSHSEVFKFTIFFPLKRKISIVMYIILQYLCKLNVQPVLYYADATESKFHRCPLPSSPLCCSLRHRLGWSEAHEGRHTLQGQTCCWYVQEEKDN